MRGAGGNTQPIDTAALPFDERVQEHDIAGDRIIAKIFDQVFITIIQLFVVFPLYIILFFGVIAAIAAAQDEPGNEDGTGLFFGAFFAVWAMMFVISHLVVIAYYYLTEGRSQRTPGKGFYDLMVVDERGEKPTRKQMLARSTLNAIVVGSQLWLGEILVMTLREDGKRLTDIITNTKVIKLTKVYRLPPEGNY